MGMRLIDSVPPARRQSAWPAMIRSAAVAMVCSPEAQKRLTVWPGTETGSPAFMAATRATFMPGLPLREGAAEDDVLHLPRLDAGRGPAPP